MQNLKAIILDEFQLIPNKLLCFLKEQFDVNLEINSIHRVDLKKNLKNDVIQFIFADIDFSIDTNLLILKQLKRNFPQLKIIVITAHNDIFVCSKLKVKFIDAIISNQMDKQKLKKLEVNGHIKSM